MAVLEVWGPGSHRVSTLAGARYTIGKREDADLSITTDAAVSGMHVLLERAGQMWCARDLGSRNGTFVNGERLFGERVLRDGDEIIVGRTRLVFRAEVSGDEPTTEGLGAPPVLTPRERVVLVELCRPLWSGNVFTQPASVREIAMSLVVSEAAVKQHLGRLYEKFGVDDDAAGPRRVQLANVALQRGAVSMSDLRTGGQL
jgi:pSer/pThr/pTyr-binding forkhead associated (FHA) protein